MAPARRVLLRQAAAGAAPWDAAGMAPARRVLLRQAAAGAAPWDAAGMAECDCHVDLRRFRLTTLVENCASLAAEARPCPHSARESPALARAFVPGRGA